MKLLWVRFSLEPVPQISKSAVAQACKPAGSSVWLRAADLETSDPAGLETCQTQRPDGRTVVAHSATLFNATLSIKLFAACANFFVLVLVLVLEFSGFRGRGRGRFFALPSAIFYPPSSP